MPPRCAQFLPYCKRRNEDEEGKWTPKTPTSPRFDTPELQNSLLDRTQRNANATSHAHAQVPAIPSCVIQPIKNPTLHALGKARKESSKTRKENGFDEDTQRASLSDHLSGVNVVAVFDFLVAINNRDISAGVVALVVVFVVIVDVGVNLVSALIVALRPAGAVKVRSNCQILIFSIA